MRLPTALIGDMHQSLSHSQRRHNAVHDRHQLSSMAGQAKEALGAEAIEALAGRGYYDGKKLLACGQNGVTAYVQPMPKGPKGEKRAADIIRFPITGGNKDNASGVYP